MEIKDLLVGAFMLLNLIFLFVMIHKLGQSYYRLGVLEEQKRAAQKAFDKFMTENEG